MPMLDRDLDKKGEGIDCSFGGFLGTDKSRVRKSFRWAALPTTSPVQINTSAGKMRVDADKGRSITTVVK